MNTVVSWLTWHLGAVGLTLLLPPMLLGEAVLSSRAGAVYHVVLVAGYGIGAVCLHLSGLKRPVPPIAVLAIAIAGYALPVAVLALVGAPPVAPLAIATVLTGSTALSLGVLAGRFRGRLGAGLVVAFAGVALASARSGALSGGGASVESRTVETSLYSVQLSFHRGLVPKSFSGNAGGGVAALDDGGVLITGDGDAYAYSWSGNGPEVRPLGLDVPMNREVPVPDPAAASWSTWFRVLDVAARSTAAGHEVYASYHRWLEEPGCFVVEVGRLTVPSLASLETGDHSWETVHRTEPCLELQLETHPGWPFRGMEGGGRMILLGGDSLLMTVGDQGFNGYDFPVDLVNDSTSSYGKSVLVDVETGAWEVFTIGHRNAQGLARTQAGEIWATEHGPQGGDELNLLAPGTHYGWPNVTYGTDYGRKVWPLAEFQGRHPDYRKPAFAWLPSSGLSALTEMTGPAFAQWEGDLLLSSLLARSLYRVRTEGGRALFVEPIPVGEPVRDLYLDSAGRVVLWTDRYNLVVMEPVSGAFGACVGCHQVADGTQHGIGPDLGGVVGRPVAGADGFDYSAGLSSVSGTWTRERLDAFLRDPAAFAPGTSMLMPPIADEATRQAVISRLEEGS